MSVHVLSYFPDLICFYRVAASIATIILGPHPAAPWLFSTALISDLFDGYFYRHYTKYDPKLSQRPYLPLDPCSDLILIICGIIYTAQHLLLLDTRGVLLVLGISLIIAAILHIIPYLGPPNQLVYTVCTTFMVHLSCFVMLATTGAVWVVNSLNWPLHATMTIAIFYLIFIRIGEKSRLVRRPPPGWRGA